VPWGHALVTDRVTEHGLLSSKTTCYHFPLYLYPDGRVDLFAHHAKSERQPNISPKLLADLERAHGRQPAPEEIFCYVYAILYAPKYREKYAVFLRTDFPRIPFTADPKLFAKIASLGKRLTELHLLRSSELDPPAYRFEGSGDRSVGKGEKDGLHYDAHDERAWINSAQAFAPVPKDVWEYQVGGYQVCDKWLKDRRGRRLDLDDVRTFCRIVTALKLTIDVQAEIDTVYPDAKGSTLPPMESTT